MTIDETPEDVIEARRRRDEAEAELAKQIEQARLNVETEMILRELHKRHPDEDWSRLLGAVERGRLP
jgi:hypothetical protein